MSGAFHVERRIVESPSYAVHEVCPHISEENKTSFQRFDIIFFEL